jgi:hypothetical protein
LPLRHDHQLHLDPLPLHHDEQLHLSLRQVRHDRQWIHLSPPPLRRRLIVWMTPHSADVAMLTYFRK